VSPRNLALLFRQGVNQVFTFSKCITTRVVVGEKFAGVCRWFVLGLD
jgi:hypothetical protein